MPTRSTTTRDRNRSVIRRSRNPCHICGEPIDYSLKYPDPGSFVVDHVVPTNRGGTDDLDNLAAAHSACNRAKSDHTSEELAPRTFVTSRRW